ncbi:MAG: hypothetical protein HY273_09315 [Gammaproteobacteria bacterium]|nr:hypothetical protein [Gammaproteobacteria bacterium]
MTKYNWTLRLAALAVLALASGCGHSAAKDDFEEIGRYVFDVYEENYSWGHTLRGFVIERDGRVRTYDHSDERWLPTQDRAGRIAETDLADKFYGSKVRLTLPADAVRAKAKLLPYAAHGTITRFSQARDRGRFGFVGYIYDPDRTSYRAVVVGADGDWLETNSSPEAQELLTWLNEVKEKVSDATR